LSKIGHDIIGNKPAQVQITSFTANLPSLSNKTETMNWIDSNFKDKLSKIGEYKFEHNKITVHDKESDLWIIVRYNERSDFLENGDRILILLGKTEYAKTSNPSKITYASVSDLNKFSGKLEKVIGCYKKEFPRYHEIVEEQRKVEEERAKKIEEMKKKFPLTVYETVTEKYVDGYLAGFNVDIQKDLDSYRISIRTPYNKRHTEGEVQRILEMLKIWGIAE
jgi:hypothetical protein